MSNEPLEPSTPRSGQSVPLIMVSVGTDHHPFERLVSWMDSWAEGNRGVRVMIQRGSAPPTTSAESQPLIPHGELCALFAEAAVAVIHGGPSTVMDARAAGRKPIVMPRDPRFGEHVDGHQLRFADHLAGHGLARVVNRQDELRTAIADALAKPGDYEVPPGPEAAPGIVAFAQVLDDLLGATSAVGGLGGPGDGIVDLNDDREVGRG